KLLPLPGEPQFADVRGRFVGVLVHDTDPRATRAAVGVLIEEPGLVQDGDVLVLAERNLEVAVNAVKRLAAAPELGRRQIMPAIYLALRKDATGKKALEWTVANEKLAKGSPDHWVAACAALRILGEKAVWKECIDRQERALDEVPEERRLSQAARSVLRLEYYASVLKGEKPPAIAGREFPHHAYVAAHEKEIGSMDEARRRFEALRAL
ncbi:MAG TPA: hypothetical protein VEI02_06210, partial [Planctomycetota bacterium]|nr:hypothetical protein [Planctomycetota bacterium]